jgi:iron(II)-dependent oxidoreductase
MWSGLVALVVAFGAVATVTGGRAATGAAGKEGLFRTAEPPREAKQGDVWVNPRDGAQMVFVPAGEFLMGSTQEQVEALDAEFRRRDLPRLPAFLDISHFYGPEEPQRRVYLDAYWIDKNPVTVAQYRKFCQATGRKMPKAPEWGWKDDLAIVNVTWQEAADYAAWAGKRLPTEAEWEKAARGTDGRQYPWGNEWDVNKCADGVGGDNLSNTRPVGRHQAGTSPYGALHMVGNVWEWCADWYNYGGYESAPERNPRGPTTGSSRVVRGGSWRFLVARVVRCANRWRGLPESRLDSLGFRCVRGLP